ncbi:hypothetical protein M0804_013340 [Polistes exclamans]|nr:hypothetical protein M0804_013340 [Polistes exclamans]
MNIEDNLSKDYQLVSYLNESFRMIYHNEENEKKIFWWWLNKFEYLANITEVPDDVMAKLFIEMVHEKIHERVKKKYPAINFTELSYEEIINHYICFFNYSSEILSHRKPFQDRNDYEREAIKKYASNLQDMYNKTIYRLRIEKDIVKQYLRKFNDMDITKYFKEFPPLSLRFRSAVKFAKAITLARYINPAFSMIKTYNSKNTGNFLEWLHKFEYVTSIIKVPDDKMLEYFNNMVDSDVHSDVELTYPLIKVSDLSYEEIINFYLEHFGTSYDLHKTRLFCRIQYKHETIENYANSLRKLSEKCIYISELNEILREQFLNGIRDNEICTVLNKFPRLSFDEMVEFAIELTKFKKITTYLKPAISMMKTYNQITEGVFYEWVNKFEYVVDIIGIPDDKIVEFFKNMVHNDVHASVQECDPTFNFSKLSYEQIVDHYLRCLCLSTEFYLHRQRFLCRKQYEHETLKHFADSLWKIQYQCKFRDHLDERLRDQFHNGIYDENIKTYIDKYPDLPFDAIVAIAIAYSNELIFMKNE